MRGAPSENASGHAQTTRTLQLFLGMRLLVATLLLGGTLAVVLDDDQGLSSFTPRFLLTLIAAIYGTSLMAGSWLMLRPAYGGIALTQIIGDLGVTISLIYVTGGTASGFSFLFGVAVLMATTVLGARAARLTGSAAMALYSALALALWQGWLPPPPDQHPEVYRLAGTDVLYAGAMHLSGLAMVTVLAGALADRLHRAGDRLQMAEANASTLARLNNDIVRSMASGLLTTDVQGRIRTLNAVGAAMLQMEPSRLVGCPLSDLLPDAEPVLTRVLSCADRAPIRNECHTRRRDGSEFLLGYSLTRLLGDQGTPTGALVVFQDLTEIELLRTAARRQERLAVLGRLSAGLAHEIRNPLSSISGSVQLVRSGPNLSAEDQRLLDIVVDEVARLDELVSTMLQVGKPHPPQRSLFDLRTLVREVVEMAQSGAGRNARVELRAELPDHGVTTYADAGQIKQVIWNLVKNALQASPPRGVVCLSVGEGDGEMVWLAVRDEGDGLSAGQQVRVYEMFHSERTHGTGIGLALVRQIVDAHQGEVRIDSAPGRGATFSVNLPRGIDHVRQPAPALQASR